MIYTETNKRNLKYLINDTLKRMSLLVEVIQLDEKKNQKKKESKKEVLLAKIDSKEAEDKRYYIAQKLKLDDADDVTDVLNRVAFKTYINMQKETKKYSAELLVSNNKVSDFIYAYGESKKIFKVQEGKLFKISFIKNGFNGIIKFKNKVINENYLKDVLFKIGIEKILFQKSFNLSKDISVIPFRSYIIIAIVNTVKNLRRYKSIINKQKREINLRYMSEGSNFTKKNQGGVSREKRIIDTEGPASQLEKKQKQDQIANAFEKLKEYIKTKMKPKRAKIYWLYIQYKTDKNFGSGDIQKSLQEIADIVGVPIGTVKSNIKRATEQIAENFPEFKALFYKGEI